MLLKKLNSNNPYYLFVAFLVIAFILYGNTLPHKYNLDDTFVTNGNPQVKKGISGLYEIFTSPYSDRENYVYGYRPLAKMSFAIEYSIWKFNPHYSHLINILLYALSLFLLFKLFQKIFTSLKPQQIWLIILLFASHPIHTEVVSSLKNREELFCFLFGFLSLWFMIRFYEKRTWYYILFGILSLFASLLSKQTGVVFLAIIPLTIIYLSKYKFEFIQQIWQLKLNFTSILIGFWYLVIIFHKLLIELNPNTDNNWLIKTLIFVSFILMVFILKYNLKLDAIKSIVTNFNLWTLVFLLVIFNILYDKIHFFVSLFYVFAFIPLLKLPINEFKKEFLKLRFSKNFIKLVGILAIVIFTTFVIFLITERITYEIAGTQDSKLYYWQNPLYFGFSETSLLANGFNSFLEYIKLIFFPYPLRFYYGYATIETQMITNPMVWIGFLLLIVIFISGFQGYIRKKPYGYGLLLFIIALIPFLNFKWIVPGVIAERLIYISSAGFAIALVDALFNMSNSKHSFLKTNHVKYVLVLTILLFSIMTIQRNRAWSSPQTLFETDLPHLSNSVKANDLYASWLLRSAQELMAKNAPIQQIKSKLDLSLYHYKRTVQIYPNHLEGWNNIGIMYTKYYNNPEEALFYFNKAISYDSTYINPYINIGAIEINSKKYKNALNTYQKILKFDSLNPNALNGIVQSLYGLNDTIEANKWNVKVLNEINAPDMYYANKGSYYLQNNDTLNAIVCFELAFNYNKNDINLCVFLGKYYAAKQNNSKASYYHDMATRIKNNINK